MPKRVAGGALVFAVALGAVACSTDGPTNSAGVPEAPGLSDYIPLDDGYSASFIVTDENGVEIRRETYTSGGATSVDGNPGVYWSGEIVDTGASSFSSILYNSGSAVFQTQTNATNHEQLLAEPLEVGASWNRWVSAVVDDGSVNDTIVVGGGSNGDGLGVNNDGDNKPLGGAGDAGEDGPAGSSYPTKGSSTFYIKSLDDVVTSGGQTFVDCLQVVNAGDGSTVNRYWYCPGHGLVKFALNCLPDSETGSENAELIG